LNSVLTHDIFPTIRVELTQGKIVTGVSFGEINMASTLLIAEDDATSRKIYSAFLEGEGYTVLEASNGNAALEIIEREPVDVLLTDVVMDGMDGMELLACARATQPNLRAIVMTSQRTPAAIIGALRNQVCDFLSKPFELEQLLDSVQTALERKTIAKIEIISAKPDWIELRVPCDLQAVEPIQKVLSEMHGYLPKETREAIGSVFREMLNNAIEHGGKLDPTKQVEVKYIRMKRAILYSIKDPGEGFQLAELKHAAIANPEDNPFHHMEVRQEKGMRPGGFGIMLASQVIDELIYNEKHNELIFVKYVEECPEPKV
jgi:CheY-like chemotaxis protein/anti-sigma regulatory factor (Ser/Thr protein kinase)